MNEITQFGTVEFNNVEFPVYGSVEEPLFDATFVARVLEQRDAYAILRCVDETEKGMYRVYTRGGIQRKTFLTEEGLYEVLFLSRKPVAKEFKKVVKGYLKDIRKTGGAGI